jgi:hypothetical protein
MLITSILLLCSVDTSFPGNWMAQHNAWLQSNYTAAQAALTQELVTNMTTMLADVKGIIDKLTQLSQVGMPAASLNAFDDFYPLQTCDVAGISGAAISRPPALLKGDGKMPLPKGAVVKPPAPAAPADTPSPAPVAADTASPAPMAADTASPAPMAAVMASPAPMAAGMAPPAPMAADVASPAPMAAGMAPPAPEAASSPAPTKAGGNRKMLL